MLIKESDIKFHGEVSSKILMVQLLDKDQTLGPQHIENSMSSQDAYGILQLDGSMMVLSAIIL